MNKVWSEVDYAQISFHLGEEYASELRRAEKLREEQARAEQERQLQMALDFQRSQLLEKLKQSQMELLSVGSVNTVDMCQLLEISRAFVFSYFGNVVSKYR